MKYFSAVLVLFTVFNFTACSDNIEPIDPNVILNPQPQPENPTANGVFSVNIDGQNFSTSNTTVYISGGSILLNATRANGDSFAMVLDGTTTGTYPANDNMIAFIPSGSEFGWWGYDAEDENADTGSIKITSVNTQNQTISGTFSYVGSWSDYAATNVLPRTFTSGVFTNLSYVTQNPVADSFHAKVNGVEFVDTDIFGFLIDVADQEYISVLAQNAEGASMTVSLKSNLPSGTYTITQSGQAQFKFALAEQTSLTPATSGSITIIEKSDDRIKGTFTSSVTIGSAVYQINEGSFDVGY